MHSTLGTPQYSFENLAGIVNDNGISIERLVSRNPVAWAARCIECSTAWTVSHARARTVSCPNALTHNRESRRRSQITQTISPTTATRSRDAQSAREYQRQETPQSIRYTFAEPTFAGADPSSVSAYLDYQEQK
jgi:hypothetical protein